MNQIKTKVLSRELISGAMLVGIGAAGYHVARAELPHLALATFGLTTQLAVLLYSESSRNRNKNLRTWILFVSFYSAGFVLSCITSRSSVIQFSQLTHAGISQHLAVAGGFLLTMLLWGLFTPLDPPLGSLWQKTFTTLGLLLSAGLVVWIAVEPRQSQDLPSSARFYAVQKQFLLAALIIYFYVVARLLFPREKNELESTPSPALQSPHPQIPAYPPSRQHPG